MRPAKDLECVRDTILTLFHHGETHQSILSQVNEQLLVQGYQAISIRSLRRQLSTWGLSRQATLEPLYEEIAEIYTSGAKIQEILSQVNQLLSVRGSQSISLRTLKTYLTIWGFSRQHHTEVSDQLIQRVRFYFYTYGFNDASILRDIQIQDRLQASPFAIRRIRWENGMKRRFRTSEEREAALRTAIQFLESDLQQSTAIRNMGRGYLYHYVRQQGNILVSQNRLYNFYRSILPEEVQKRREGNFKHRTDFSVPGPNFLWCLDGYEKLKRFGFQIYACVDAYSRCIIWFYVGRSATTSLSTLKQYLRTIQRLGMRPFFTRSDHGVETPLWVAAQAMLAQVGPAEISYEDEAGNQHRYRQGERIQSCHMYGPSTRNIRIESWWSQLRKGATDRWIVRSCSRTEITSTNIIY